MSSTPDPNDERGRWLRGDLLIGCAVIAIAGAIALVLGNIVGSMVVPGHDWIADTVSDLGAGRYEIIQDVALYGFAASLGACAVGAAHDHRDGSRWSAGILCLCLLAVCVIVIGARNEYGDGDNEGIVVHFYVVIALGALFTATFWLMARGMGSAGAVYRWISLACMVLWGIGAPIFFFLPTGMDGAWERGLGVITVVWTLTFAALLFRSWRTARRHAP